MSRILIIEDDRCFYEVLQANLEESGHICKIEDRAVNVLKNIDMVSGYEAIILDLMMPKDDELISYGNSRLAAGEILYNKIREKYKSTKIYIITAKDRKQLNIDTTQDTNTMLFFKPADDATIDRILEDIK